MSGQRQVMSGPVLGQVRSGKFRSVQVKMKSGQVKVRSGQDKIGADKIR